MSTNEEFTIQVDISQKQYGRVPYNTGSFDPFLKNSNQANAGGINTLQMRESNDGSYDSQELLANYGPQSN